MRLLIGMLVLVGMALIVDEIAFDGRYRDATWREAKQQGQQINMKLNGWLRKYGL
jgi:hypothetical protein